jgi:hypothetical protein
MEKNSDPGWKKVGSGINIPDLQTCLPVVRYLRYFYSRDVVIVFCMVGLVNFSLVLPYTVRVNL